jgi:hypothetical protein
MQMSKAVTAHMIFHELLNRFATSADRTEGPGAISAMQLCTRDMKFGFGDDEPELPKGNLANMLMMRSIAKHRTKHHVAAPTIKSFSDDRICGTAPIASYRMEEDGTPSFAVSEFYAEIIPNVENEGDWLIHKLTMSPFAMYINGQPPEEKAK